MAGLLSSESHAQTVIPATSALPLSAADTSKPGFLWRVHQVETSQPTTLARTEAQLAGLLGNNVADPNAIRVKRDQLNQLNTDFKRKGEDAEAAYAKRRQEIFLPLQTDIGKALEVFAKARGITVIVDGSQVPVVYAADNIDITRAFIADFNSKNPATAAVTQP